MTPKLLNRAVCESALILVTDKPIKKTKDCTYQQTKIGDFEIRLSVPKDGERPATLEISDKSDHRLLAKFLCTQEGQGTLIPIESETVEDWSLQLMEHAAPIIAERTAEQKPERLN